MDKGISYNIVFSKNVVEFVTVAVQYCSYLEQIEINNLTESTDKLTKILPLLYLKAVLVPEVDVEEEVYPEITVTEDDYNYVLSKLYNVYKNDDAYLEVFLDDMKFSDTPITASISENLTDIYQDIKNFISIYEMGDEDSMLEALYTCFEHFKLYWGQKLVNVLRALHSLKYSLIPHGAEDDLSSENSEKEW